MRRGEIPYPFDAAGHQPVGNHLGLSARHRDDAQAHTQTAHQILQARHAIDGLPADSLPHHILIHIETRHHIQAIVLEARVLQQRLAQSANAHQHGFVVAVVAQVALHVLQQLLRAEPQLGTARDGADTRQVLPHLHRVER